MTTKTPDVNVIYKKYQKAVEIFSKELETIDAQHNTYAKIEIDDIQSRPMRIHGEETKPPHKYREITIDEIIIQGIDN